MALRAFSCFFRAIRNPWSNQVHVVAPQFGGVTAADIAAQQILALVAADGLEFVAVQFDTESRGRDRLSGGCTQSGRLSRL